MNRFAVILSHNRPELLKQTVAAIGPQVDLVIVIDNASEPPARDDDIAGDNWVTQVLQVPDQPPNLADLWQRGINIATRHNAMDNQFGDPWHIAFLCDDAPPPPGWFATVVDAMNETGAAIGASNPWGHPHLPILKTEPDRDLMGRMPGWAFVLDPRSGVRPDLSMHWWWLDTDMDWQARKAGGTVMIGGYAVPNARPNEYTATRPWAAERIHLDTLAFEAKHGPKPW